MAILVSVTLSVPLLPPKTLSRAHAQGMYLRTPGPATLACGTTMMKVSRLHALQQEPRRSRPFPNLIHQDHLLIFVVIAVPLHGFDPRPNHPKQQGVRSSAVTDLQIVSVTHLTAFQKSIPRKRLGKRRLSLRLGGALEFGAAARPRHTKPLKHRMVLGEHTLKMTLYEVLSVGEDASYEDIKASYRTKVLSHHPDKLRVPAASETAYPDKFKFHEIQEAWEILSDARSRRRYDRELQASRQDVLVSEDVRLDEMTVEDVGEALQLLYSCRCGDYFSIDSQDLEDMGYPLLKDESGMSIKTPDGSPASVVIPCGSCSLRIRLVVESDATTFYG
ncbi:hypothetical protein SAY86_001147 [Trapa natans]|uniref:Uncharacterized protein n=1 Tax=Trapa natans TaxID=22666 RepID=A0AAN7MC43_TRANT|nr:hypothetical protein SAY86_001147 [Trapa natans]